MLLSAGKAVGDGPGALLVGSEDWPRSPEGSLLLPLGQSQVHKGTGARMFIVVLAVRSCRQGRGFPGRLNRRNTPRQHGAPQSAARHI